MAVAIPDAERERILAATEALRARGLAIRWVEPEAFHLTLKFLGEVPEDSVGEVRRAVSDVATRQPPVAVRLCGAGAFPSARRPSVWWIGVAPNPGLQRLRAAVEATLAPLGYPTEARPFSPHLTIGRTQREAVVRDAEALLQDVRYESTFTVTTLDLMRSHLSPRGARYQRLLAARLAS